MEIWANLKISAWREDMPIQLSEQEDMETRFSLPEMLVPIYQNTRRHTPKHNNIHVF